MSLDHMFAVQFGTGMLHPLVGVLAVTLGVRLVRPEAVVLASCASLAALVAMLPGVTELADALTGAGPIAWRLILLVPVAVLTGVLVAEGLPRLVPAGPVRLVAGLLAVVVVVVSGRPLWQVTHASIDPAPRWKVDQVALADVEEVLDLPAEEGLLLLPERQSEVLAIYTTSRFAAVPRVFYLVNLDDTLERVSARNALHMWVNSGYRQIPRTVRAKLDLLDVAVLCVPGDDPGLVDELEQVADVSGAPVDRVGSMVCATRTGGSWT